MPDTKVNPQRWLWVMRPKRIQMICTHATRGATTPSKQFGATVNWMESPNNVGARHPTGPLQGQPAWGSSCSAILDRNGDVGWVLLDNQSPTYGAGFGTLFLPGNDPYWVGEYASEWEWCQSANREDFTTAQYDRGALEYAKLCLKYDIPVVHLTLNHQVEPAPRGLTRHDKTENGHKLGKSDPGTKFHEEDFEDLIRQKKVELVGGTDVAVTRVYQMDGKPEVYTEAGLHIPDPDAYNGLKATTEARGDTWEHTNLPPNDQLWRLFALPPSYRA